MRMVDDVLSADRNSSEGKVVQACCVGEGDVICNALSHDFDQISSAEQILRAGNYKKARLITSVKATAAA